MESINRFGSEFGVFCKDVVVYFFEFDFVFELLIGCE